MQVGGRGQSDLDHLTLGVADRGDIVVGRQGRDIARVHAIGLELLRIEPGAQREGLAAEDLGRLHALDGLQARLHHTNQVIRDLVRGERALVKAMYIASIVCPTLTVMVGCNVPAGSWLSTDSP